MRNFLIATMVAATVSEIAKVETEKKINGNTTITLKDGKAFTRPTSYFFSEGIVPPVVGQAVAYYGDKNMFFVLSNEEMEANDEIILMDEKYKRTPTVYLSIETK